MAGNKGSPAQGELSPKATEGSPLTDLAVYRDPSVTACAVTPPFAQGSLWACGSLRAQTPLNRTLGTFGLTMSASCRISGSVKAPRPCAAMRSPESLKPWM